jgi:hypothetical protein
MKREKNMKKVKKRVVWGFNPTTRVVVSKRVYSRKNIKSELKNYLY